MGVVCGFASSERTADPAALDAIRGLLSGRGNGAIITALWAGEICAFR